MTIFKYFTIVFFRKFLWLHYFVFISLYLVQGEVRLYLLFILLFNLFIQQIKILNHYKDLFRIAKLYSISLYSLGFYIFTFGLILLSPYVKIIGIFNIFSILFSGLVINTIKIYYYESY